jgi:multidrug resistance efflux pump
MRLSRSSRRGLEEAGIGENGVEELTPAKQATADTGSANPLRKAALMVVAVTILLFALSIVMERFTPSSSQAVVQAYVVRMAPEVAGRVIGVDVADNVRVDAGQVLFRIDPRPFELAVAEAQAQVEQIGQTLGASMAAVESAQARVVKEAAELENVEAQTGRVFELVKRGVYPAAKADTARAAQEGRWRLRLGRALCHSSLAPSASAAWVTTSAERTVTNSMSPGWAVNRSVQPAGGGTSADGSWAWSAASPAIGDVGFGGIGGVVFMGRPAG